MQIPTIASVQASPVSTTTHWAAQVCTARPAHVCHALNLVPQTLCAPTACSPSPTATPDFMQKQAHMFGTQWLCANVTQVPECSKGDQSCTSWVHNGLPAVCFAWPIPWFIANWRAETESVKRYCSTSAFVGNYLQCLKKVNRPRCS